MLLGRLYVLFGEMSIQVFYPFFDQVVCFFNDTATTEIYTLSLHDALPILSQQLNIKNKQPNQKMGRIPKQTFLQRRHTDGQKAHEKMLNIANYWKNANQNYNEVSPHTGHNGHHQKVYKE